MTTTVTLAYEGPPSCKDCQREGIPVCAHIGFNAEAWVDLPGSTVMVPGLDPAYAHTVRDVTISSDRNTVTLTVDTARPLQMDLARHLSLISTTPKAWIRAVHGDTDETLTEGGFDAFLQQGQQVWVAGAPYVVSAVDHPSRHPEHGTVDGGRDWQVATLRPMPEPTPTRVEP
ncbi:hypothetical protein [Actinocrispum wychmicini]|nr:hypothetical protein [Actinocrispum wychmicini]